MAEDRPLGNTSNFSLQPSPWLCWKMSPSPSRLTASASKSPLGSLSPSTGEQSPLSLGSLHALSSPWCSTGHTAIITCSCVCLPSPLAPVSQGQGWVQSYLSPWCLVQCSVKVHGWMNDWRSTFSEICDIICISCPSGRRLSCLGGYCFWEEPFCQPSANDLPEESGPTPMAWLSKPSIGNVHPFLHCLSKS